MRANIPKRQKLLNYWMTIMIPLIYLTNAGFILLSAIVIYAGQYVIEKGIRSAILLTKTTKNTKSAGNNNDTD